MLSFDYGKLDQVVAFASFLEVLSKPEEFKKMVADFSAMVASYKEVLEAKTKVAEVDTYVAKEYRKLDERVSKTETLEKEVAAKKASALSELEILNTKAMALNAKAEQSFKEAEALQSKLRAELLTAEAETKRLQDQKVSLDNLQKHLQQEKMDLDQKAAKLKAVFE